MWQTKYAAAIPKNLWVGVNFRPYSECYLLSGVRSPWCPPYNHLPTRFSDPPMALLRIYILWYLSAHCCTQYICQIIHSNPALHCFSIVIYDQAIDGPMGLELLLGFFYGFPEDFFFEILTYLKDEKYVCCKSLRPLSLLLQATYLKRKNTYS